MRNLWYGAAAAALLAACSSARKVDEPPPKWPALATEANGLVGYVKDAADAPVVGATVYLVPASDIPTAALALTSIDTERSSTVDEPLEDLIQLHAADYVQSQGPSDASGVYRIPTVPAGSYYIVARPGGTDLGHIVGGSLCRTALDATTGIIGKQLDVTLSTKPSATAEFVGPSKCLGCHSGASHEEQTLHMLGIRPVGRTGPLQDSSRFTQWNDALTQKFTSSGTTLVFYDYATTPDWKLSEEANVLNGAVVSFKARLYSDTSVPTKYFVELTDVKGFTNVASWAASTDYTAGQRVINGTSKYECITGGTSDASGGPSGTGSDITDGSAHWKFLGASTAVYEVELSYGGGLYKQRYVAKIGNARFVLPIQYNTDAAANKAGTEADGDPFSRWTWTQYNAQNWFADDTATTNNGAHLKQPAAEKSFDNACAGCHFTGYKLDVATNTAHAVADTSGEYDYDGDGAAELMNVSCETCHGPGSEHVAQGGNGKAIVSPKLLTPERAVTICAGCHTRAIGNGGVRSGTGALNSEAPLGDLIDEVGVTTSRMPIAGLSRAEFLTSYISKLDDGIWGSGTGGGDGLHAKKHHQQASDFLKTAKYRNPYRLLTCSSCHDTHGTSGLEHQLLSALDGSAGKGLCLGCHEQYLIADTSYSTSGKTVAEIEQKHWVEQGIVDTGMGSSIRCIDCHMPKTAKSGSGLEQKTIQSVKYWSGDISSHLFDVPLRTSITTKSSGMMAIPYTNKCGGCHTAAP